MFGLFSRKDDVSVYCQNCGTDITAQGADVSQSGRTYCHGYKESGFGAPCGTEAVFKNIETGFGVFDYYKPKKVQKAIATKEIKQFGPLENKVL